MTVAIMMPVGNNTLGRIWNVTGELVDGGEMPQIDEYYPLHRERCKAESALMYRCLEAEAQPDEAAQLLEGLCTIHRKEEACWWA